MKKKLKAFLGVLAIDTITNLIFVMTTGVSFTTNLLIYSALFSFAVIFTLDKLKVLEE